MFMHFSVQKKCVAQNILKSHVWLQIRDDLAHKSQKLPLKKSTDWI